MTKTATVAGELEHAFIVRELKGGYGVFLGDELITRTAEEYEALEYIERLTAPKGRQT